MRLRDVWKIELDENFFFVPVNDVYTMIPFLSCFHSVRSSFFIYKTAKKLR